jgi:hypothetical protein
MMVDDRLRRDQDSAEAYVDDIVVGTRVEHWEDLFAALTRTYAGNSPF